MCFWRYEKILQENLMGPSKQYHAVLCYFPRIYFSFFSSYASGTLLSSFVLCHLDPCGTSEDHLDQPLFPEVTIYTHTYIYIYVMDICGSKLNKISNIITFLIFLLFISVQGFKFSPILFKTLIQPDLAVFVILHVLDKERRKYWEINCFIKKSKINPCKEIQKVFSKF